jgi:hypothetical protein
VGVVSNVSCEVDAGMGTQGHTIEFENREIKARSYRSTKQGIRDRYEMLVGN